MSWINNFIGPCLMDILIDPNLVFANRSFSLMILNQITITIIIHVLLLLPVSAFSLSMSSKEIYGIKRSGWTAEQWRWGYGQGTGHDCAMISRQTYATPQLRAALVRSLIEAKVAEPPFEEVKLVMALAWQNGRWDGSDGGPDGYSQVLQAMAEAKRYELGTEEECSRRLIQDMQDRFPLLEPTEAALNMMQCLWDNLPANLDDFDAARRRCSGLVLESMGWIN